MITSTAQAGQDKFAFYMSGEKTDGTFLDIGCNDPVFHSNTFALESVGWRGLLVDIGLFQSYRISRFVQADATKPCREIQNFLSTCQWRIDYLSVDVDGPQYEALMVLPISRLFAGVITVEHDVYLRGPVVRDKIRGLLGGLGYDLVCSDVIAEGYGPFEDWYVHPSYADQKRRDSKRFNSPIGRLV